MCLLVDAYRGVTIDSVILLIKSLGMPSEVSCEGRLSGGFTLDGFIRFANLVVSKSFLCRFRGMRTHGKNAIFGPLIRIVSV